MSKVDILIEDVYLVVGPNFAHLRKREVIPSDDFRFLSKSIGLSQERREIFEPGDKA